MAQNSKIEWTDHTFNPWIGCTKVSPACDGCYAESWAKRTGQSHLWAGKRRRTTPANWQQPLKWDREARAAAVRRRVFCASLADIFDNQVPAEWRADLLELVGRTTNLDWLLLTKRIGNASSMLNEAVDRLSHGLNTWDERPWPNVWIGATVVTQTEIDRDVPKLIATPARVRFLSCEPLIEDVSFRWGSWEPVRDRDQYSALRRLDWIIVGGESGPKARPMAQEWVERIRFECWAAGVAFFMKQGSQANWPDYKDFSRFASHIQVREWPLTEVA